MQLRSTLLAMAISAATFSTTAYAGAESGGFIGMGIGQSSIEFPELGGSFEADDTGYKFMLGYNFGIVPLLDLGIEGAYVNFGDLKDGPIEYKQTAWDGFGLIGLSLGPFGLFGKGGLAAWDGETTIGSTTTKKSGTDPVYGIGARLQIAKVSARLEYEYFDLEGTGDTSMTLFGLLYTF